MNEDNGMAPISALQFMLNLIALQNPNIPQTPVTGTFGEETLEAVMTFQREYGLPVTGVVNGATWDAINTIYRTIEAADLRPRASNIYPYSEQAFRPYDSSAYLYPIQGMFAALSHVFENIEKDQADGVLSGPTLDNTRLLQQSSSDHAVEVFDQELWNTLARLYDTFVIRNPNYHGEQT